MSEANISTTSSQVIVNVDPLYEHELERATKLSLGTKHVQCTVNGTTYYYVTAIRNDAGHIMGFEGSLSLETPEERVRFNVPKSPTYRT